jgi:putative ABC transport system substrate-binding protein
MSLYPSELAAKSVQLLRRLLPSATLIGYLINPSTPAASIYTAEASAAANALGISIRILSASTEQELDELFATLPKSGISGLAIPAEPFFDSQRDRIVALAARYSVPAIYGLREYAVAGGLMSYGTSLPDTYRRAAIYVGRVLKGEKPADLPVVQPTKYDLVLNMKTAKSLGLNVTEQLLALADEVIE